MSLKSIFNTASDDEILEMKNISDAIRAANIGGNEDISVAIDLVRGFKYKEKFAKEWKEFLSYKLVTAARPAAIKICGVLLQEGANPNYKTPKSNFLYPETTALIEAACVFDAKNTILTDMLLRSGADPSIKDGEGKTAFDHARKNRTGATISLLRTAMQKRGLSPS